MSHVADAHPIRFDENGAPMSLRFDDPFFSRHDGPAETRHIFHSGNQLEARLPQATRFTIGETGFGTALNALETWALWDRMRRSDATLRYVSFEAYPLARDDLARCIAAWPEHRQRGEVLLAALPGQWPDSGCITVNFAGFALEIVIGLAENTIPVHDLTADAWYLDGHSPQKNADMWSLPLMQAVFDHTVPDGSFASYTSAGWVRRNLQAAGFVVEKRPGFGGKREMSRGVKPA
ncbi:MAG: tRNA (5-methylaminomethyl-2-thiouridine)(34)-methyltransferase MnmD [Rhizobiaceae bacterium]|nr:tRNA (5-methylaminomethyl-2-thiouridine)(34)-methyltransferase MnmD [Rhizobiaceae bacterium]